ISEERTRQGRGAPIEHADLGRDRGSRSEQHLLPAAFAFEGEERKTRCHQVRQRSARRSDPRLMCFEFEHSPIGPKSANRNKLSPSDQMSSDLVIGRRKSSASASLDRRTLPHRAENRRPPQASLTKPPNPWNRSRVMRLHRLRSLAPTLSTLISIACGAAF